jgi:hypothetical protein
MQVINKGGPREAPLAVVALILLLLVLLHVISIDQGVVGVFTVAIAGLLGTRFKEHEHRTGFWPLIGAFFLIHCVLMYALLMHVTKLFLIKGTLVFSLETFLMGIAIEWIFGPNDKDGSEKMV